MIKLYLDIREFTYIYSKVLEDKKYIDYNKKSDNDIDPSFKSFVTKLMNKLDKVKVT